jgi:hypothetical protein
MAADYVVNDMIVSLKDKTIAKLPEGGCYDPKYHNMNMREVYRLLKEEQEEKQKQVDRSGSDLDETPIKTGTIKACPPWPCSTSPTLR